RGDETVGRQVVQFLTAQRPRVDARGLESPVQAVADAQRPLAWLERRDVALDVGRTRSEEPGTQRPLHESRARSGDDRGDEVPLPRDHGDAGLELAEREPAIPEHEPEAVTADERLLAGFGGGRAEPRLNRELA